jgi:ribosomal protein S1
VLNIRTNIFVTIGDLSASLILSDVDISYIRDIPDFIRVNDDLDVVVTRIDKGVIYVSRKVLDLGEFLALTQNHYVGEEVMCTLVEKYSKDMVFQIDEQLFGLLLHSEYSDYSYNNFEETIQIGDKIYLRITRIFKDCPKIYLSRRQSKHNIFIYPFLDIKTPRENQKVNFEEIIKLVETKEMVNAKVIRCEEKYLLLDYLGYTIILPEGLMEYSYRNRKNTLKDKVIEVVIDKAQILDTDRFDIRANQIPIFRIIRKNIKIKYREDKKAADEAYFKELEKIEVGKLIWRQFLRLKMIVLLLK